MREEVSAGCMPFRSGPHLRACVLLRVAFALVSSMLLTSTAAFAQDTREKNELAVGVGRTFISDQRVPNTNFFDNTVHSGKGLSFNFLYARQLRFFQMG